MTTGKKAPAPAPRRARSEDQPLIDDIRLLGRILGDVIREQEGKETYELVEKVRTLSVSFRRDADQAADRALKTLLKGLSANETVRVIRAFTCSACQRARRLSRVAITMLLKAVFQV